VRLLRRLDLASELVLILLVVGTPLAFGSVQVWATDLMKTGILLFVLLRLARNLLAPGAGSEPVGIKGTGLEVPAAIFVGLVLLQVMPLPSSVIRLVSPKADALYRQTLPGYPATEDLRRVEEQLVRDTSATPLAVAGAGIGVPRPRAMRTLSIYPEGTWDKLSLLLTYLVLFFAAIEYAREPVRRIRLLMAVTITGLGIAAFALLQQMTWNGKIYWLLKVSPHVRAFGPFVDRDHFTGYMELVLPVTVGLLLLVWRQRAAPSRTVPLDRPPEAGLIVFPRTESRHSDYLAGWGEAALPKTAVTLCAMLVAVLAIIASGSRGGLIATALTFTLFAGALAPERGRRRVALAGGMAAALLVSVVVLAPFGVGPLNAAFTRLLDIGTEASFAGRWMTWGRVMELIADHPLIGTGLGTFREAYSSYYPPGVDVVWVQAHNDYLQLVAETGIAGGLLLIGGLIVYGRRVFLPALGPAPERELRLGIAMALTSIGLHSFVDFNLQIPSNGMLTVLLGGVLAATVLPGGGPTKGA